MLLLRVELLVHVTHPCWEHSPYCKVTDAAAHAWLTWERFSMDLTYKQLDLTAGVAHMFVSLMLLFEAQAAQINV